MGSLVGAWIRFPVGTWVGALLVPGCGFTGAGSVCGPVGLGSGGVSSGGASAPSAACACIGSGDPVRVLRLYTTNTLDIL